MKTHRLALAVMALCVLCACAPEVPEEAAQPAEETTSPPAEEAVVEETAPAIPEDPEFTNTIGMKLTRIEPGQFVMGSDDTPLPEDLTKGRKNMLTGDFDEHPAHPVTISSPFYMGICEVTNADYEQFDPGHATLRGKMGFSKEDREAVVFVSWHDAVHFCEWLSQKEGLPYRLPTEAEWEYACRAGTTTLFHTGDSLPEEFQNNVGESWYPDPDRIPEGRTLEDDIVPIHVGRTPPNPWGLYDMHGNVEEWCSDWYGPYEAAPQTDPVGRADGDFRVTRGGSHSTKLFYLRSANRMGTLPDDTSWLIGFRVVLGEPSQTEPLLPVPTPACQQNVKQEVPADVTSGPDPEQPFFKGPRQYVKIADDSWGPLFSQHNHDPAIVECPNGDLFTIWYTTVGESSRELALAASRLPYGEEEWQEASPFWDAPDRNDHAPAAWFDGDQTIYHFVGLSAAATWGNLATIMRKSTDNGATWTKARIIAPDHTIRHQPVESVFRTKEGAIILPCDASSRGEGGTAIHVSEDDGLNWADPGGKIAGIHGGALQLENGSLMGLGRGDNIKDDSGTMRMPKSISADMGVTWDYSPTEFEPIAGGQRLALIRLHERPILLCSFASKIEAIDGAGKLNTCTGLFAALSLDEGQTWPIKRLITPGGDHEIERTDGGTFRLTDTVAEPSGYLSICQSLDGVINLISSRQHYAFNLAWVKEFSGQ